MRIVRFGRKLLPQFQSMANSAKGAFGKSWFLHIMEVFSQPGCKKHGVFKHAALEGGELVGVLATKKEADAFVIYFILVKNEFLGKGIGSKLVAYAEKLARRSNAKFLRASIYSGRPIENFYKKQGFQVGGNTAFYREEGDTITFLYKRL